MAEPRKRQAVILIHGIGEQRPIDTLRSFVESVTGYLKERHHFGEDEVIFWEKPDPESGNFETRKMTVRKGLKHPTTDFYEFYWAHHFRDTNFGHVKDWLRRVVFRRPGSVSPRLKTVFVVVWAIFLLILALMVYYACTHGLMQLWGSLVALASGVALTVLLKLVAGPLFGYLGDAARYLDPAPGNIGERKSIRSEGITLLTRLHESGKYDRIVIVGHSLGSVIAYDLVKFLWNEYYKTFDPEKFKALVQNDDKSYFAHLQHFEALSHQMGKGETTEDELCEAQRKCHLYYKAIGNKWLVSDLLTIGSPLAHAGHLFVYKKDLFEKLKEQREYPTCPPRFQRPDVTNIVRSDKFFIPGIDHPLILKRFNHSSPFAVVNWTNIYYKGDYIGGPLKEVFGQGIRDIETERRKGIPAIPQGHTSYWDLADKHHVLKEIWKVLEG
ncbi:MAG: DUF1097 domain-containing protein [Breznakibacter sp.]